jgi:hypothetical protein
MMQYRKTAKQPLGEGGAIPATGREAHIVV